MYLDIVTSSSCQSLRSELDIFYFWTKYIGLELNHEKGPVMTSFRRRSLILYDYSLGGITLNHVSLFKDFI